MRHLVGMLYFVTALAGLYWSVRLVLLGLYDVPVSIWFVVVFIGSATLLVGAVLWWTSTRAWAQWLPLLGSLLLASYFVPASVEILRSYSRSEVAGGTQLAVRLTTVALILASLIAAISYTIGEWRVTSNRHG